MAGEPIQPIAYNVKGVPLVYPVLQVSLHLEPLRAEDAEAFEVVADEIHGWIGDQLHWSSDSTFQVLSGYRRDDLDYIPGYVRCLAITPAAGANPQEQFVLNAFHGATYGDYSVVLSGGDMSGDRGPVSPFTARFSTIMRQPEEGGDPFTMAMLRVTVPLSWPVGDFMERVMRLASHLRVCWGVAGHGYAAWEVERPEAREAIYAHARRHVGFDVGIYAAWLEEWHAQMRTVGWLTFVGGALREQLDAAGARLESHGDVEVRQVGPNLMLRAGRYPQTGDINRLDVPAAYRAVDSMLRPIRAADGHDFRHPWNEDTTTAWLERFERRLARTT